MRGKQRWMNASRAYIAKNQIRKLKPNDIILIRPIWCSSKLEAVKIKSNHSWYALIYYKSFMRKISHGEIIKKVTKYYPEMTL